MHFRRIQKFVSKDSLFLVFRFYMSFYKRQESEGMKMMNLKINKKGIVKNKDSGITLISLVVTIIVLLILAGISISMLSRR